MNRFKFTSKVFDLLELDFVILADTKEEALSKVKSALEERISSVIKSDVIFSCKISERMLEFGETGLLSDDSLLYKKSVVDRYVFVNDFEEDIPTKPDTPISLKPKSRRGKKL